MFKDIFLAIQHLNWTHFFCWVLYGTFHLSPDAAVACARGELALSVESALTLVYFSTLIQLEIWFFALFLLTGRLVVSCSQTFRMMAEGPLAIHILLYYCKQYNRSKKSVSGCHTKAVYISNKGNKN